LENRYFIIQGSEIIMEENTFYIYVIKNDKGRFVSNLTNPRHKYFDKLQESTKLKAKSTNCKIYKVKCEIVEEIKE
jgi:hypothetical protein